MTRSTVSRNRMDSYDVTVIATDPKGIPTDDGAEDTTNDPFRDTVMVTISVTAVDEPPIFTAASDEDNTSRDVRRGERDRRRTMLQTVLAK